MTAIIIVFYIINNKIIHSYDGTQESADKINKLIPIFELGTVFLALLNSFIVPCIVTLGFKLRGDPTFFIPILTTFYGATFLYALCFYIIFFQNMQKEIKDLPFSRKNIFFPIISRSIIVSGFSSAGLILFMFSSLFSPSIQGLSLKEMLLFYFLPSGLSGALAIIIDNFFR